jgi:hypothetical protein
METKENVIRFHEAIKNVKTEIRRDVVGQDEIVDNVIIAIIAGGNVLLEGVPGVAKTRLVRSLSKALKLDFSRIQFTPDLMPSDITGTNVIFDVHMTTDEEVLPGQLGHGSVSGKGSGTINFSTSGSSVLAESTRKMNDVISTAYVGTEREYSEKEKAWNTKASIKVYAWAELPDLRQVMGKE